jgi:tRNA-modifying protein YgfZ
MANWFALEHLSSVVLAGADADVFAQSQFTGNILEQEAGRWQPTAWCDSKGRALVVMLAARREDAVEIVTPASQLQTLLSRLPMYAIGRKVQIHEGGSVQGCCDHDQPENGLAFDADRAIRLADGPARTDQEWLRRWQLADLQSRIPWLTPETSGQHLPQSLGLEALDAISYSKGCYPGQEVIARVHFLGKVKHRLAVLSLDTPHPPAPGIAVTDRSGAGLGQLLWSVPDNGESFGLAVVHSEATTGLEIAVDIDNLIIRGQVSL